MENMMASFSSKEFGQIRVIQEKGKCLFCGLDVAKALGYKNNRKALTDHCRCVTKRYAPLLLAARSRSSLSRKAMCTG